MKQTAIMKLVSRFRELETSHTHLASTTILNILEGSIREEERQIKEAFNDGMSFGKSDVHMDYPASRYYSGTYLEPDEPK